MKKIINYTLITALLIVGIFILTGCDNNKKEENNTVEKTTESTVENTSDEKTTTSLNTMTDNDYYEKAAEFVKAEILKSESDMSDKKDYQKFVEYEGFGVAEENGIMYAYMHIGDASYYIEDGKIEQGPASSMAYKVKFVNGEPISYENPTDGAGQEEDYKKLFPADIASKMFTYNFDFTRLDNAAKAYYES